MHTIGMRSLLGFFSALAYMLVFGPSWIKLSATFLRSKVRQDTPTHHQKKNNTPTMGGILIIMVILGNIALWVNCANPYIGIIVWCLCTFGLLGAWDDWCKIRYKKGINATTKFIAQLIAAASTIGLWFYYVYPIDSIVIPYTFWSLSIGSFLFFLWALFVLVATSNAVNITDGLDGLATGSLIPTFACASILAYILSPIYIDTASAECMVVGSIFVGALLGFLWYNKHPANIFMGDVGSLSLGATLACMMLLIRHELLLSIIGLVFVAETASVIVQVIWYKAYGKRLFKMAPLHHHFELMGWHEKQITLAFSLVSCVLCIMIVLMYCI
jgi:phospho-N-acetylmuramoyl-pentapeptide-transferase